MPARKNTPAATKAAPKPPTKAPAKAAGKSAAKPAARPVPKPTPVATPPAKPSGKPAAEAAVVPKKPKLVRDSFTMPKADFDLIDQLKARAMGFGRHVKKSELLRAGLQSLGKLDDAALRAVLVALPQLKPGRPGKHG